MDRPPVCAVHPEVAAAATCERCGNFACDACCRIFDEKLLCAECIERVEGEGLRELSGLFWKKPDVFAFLFGLHGACGMAGTVFVLLIISVAGTMPVPLVFLYWPISAFVHLSYALLRGWARAAVSGLPLLLVGGLLLGGAGADELAGAGCFQAGMLALYIVAWQSPRNELAFGIEVPDEELRQFARELTENAVALRGCVLGALSLGVPLLEVVALPMSILGQLRATHPRIGRGRLAAAGTLLSVLGALSTYGLAYWYLATR